MESVGDLQSLGDVLPRVNCKAPAYLIYLLLSWRCGQSHTDMDPANQPAEWPVLDLDLPDHEPK